MNKEYTNSENEKTEMFETTDGKIVIYKDDNFCAREFDKDEEETAWEAFKDYAGLHPNTRWSEI